jgi:PmbA protein
VIKSDKHYSNLEDAVSDVKRGIYLVNSIGSWLSNPANGQINATVSLGYLIVDGEIREPVKGLVVGGNIYKVLNEGFIGTAGKTECMMGVCTPIIVVDGVSYA